MDDELGPLEMQVLGLLDADAGSSVHAVQASLKHHGRDLEYTTVMTVLSRLHKKGLVARTKEGRRFVYSPAAQAGNVARRLLARVGRSLFRNDRTSPILHLLEDKRLSHDELVALRKVIDDRLRSKR